MKQLLNDIIDQYFIFIEENKPGDYTMQDFLGYLNSANATDWIGIRKIGGEKDEVFGKDYRNPSSDISILLVLMYRYAKGYIKKALAGSVLQSADEFSFLITLMTYESMTKSELITKQVMEKTSGSEIIKRLAGNGLIEESDDPDDGRSVRVSITEKGKMEILSILPLMSEVSRLITGNLSDVEIKTLLYLLKKLDCFHNDIFLNHRKASIGDLMESGLMAKNT